MKIPILYIYNFIFLSGFLILCEFKVLPKKIYKQICFIYFVFIFGQRWSAGVDFYGYLKYYISGFQTEVGYRLIQNYLYNNNIYFGVLIFGIYLFTTSVSLWFLLKFVNSNYSIYIFFLSEYHIMSINPLRSYIAINIFLIGLYTIFYQGKRLKSFFILIFASLFHKTSIILFPILIFFRKLIKIEKKFRYIIGGILLILPFFPTYSLLKLLKDYIPKYGNYIGSIYDMPLSFLNILRYYIVLFFLGIYSKLIKKRNKDYWFIYGGLILYIFLMGISISFAPLHRIAYYFKIFEVLYFAYSYEYLKNKYNKNLIIVFFIFNYIAIGYKDMGALRYYELKILRFYNITNNSKYIKEINENKVNLNKKLRSRSKEE